MTAAPGWYPAGVPGRERWWDGVQWTASERDAAESLAPAAPLSQQAPMGWYAFPSSGLLRWWNGAHWTAYRVKEGRPGTDAYAMEPAGMGWLIGGLFVAAGLLNLLSALVDPLNLLLAVLFLLVGALWLVGAGRDAARRRVPAPTTAPASDDVLRPLPGEAEASDAGWYPVAGKMLHRWWTGSRWAAYVSDKGFVRPTHSGPRAYLVAMIVGAAVAALALITIGVGIVLSVGGDDVAGPMLTVVGAVALFLGGVILVSVWMRRYALILPKEPPSR